MFGIGTAEMVVLGIIALLLFGKRLPEVARSVGKGILEFKKGVQGVEEEVNTATSRTETRRPEARELEAPITAPRFEPPKSAPTVASGASAESANAAG